MMLKRIVHKIMNAMGYKIVWAWAPDMGKEFRDLAKKCENYTSTTTERMYALYKATQYTVAQKVPGDIVECGVWKGGSCMLSALILKHMGETNKKIYMYDTYQGMSEPSTIDVSHWGGEAMERWKKLQRGNHNEWAYVSLEEVKKNMFSTGYPQENLVFIKGKVQETIPQVMPDKVSLLRLDTDWYESTYHELLYLFPRLSQNGVIIIDDYGYWKGVKEATDKYFQENAVKILLNRIDHSGRIGIKTST
jgi:hypothetical protein